MRYVAVFIAILISSNLFAQKFPFGKYYSLPQAQNADSEIFYIRETSITKDSISEAFVERDLKKMAVNPFRSVVRVDSIFKRDSQFYFIYFKENKYDFISILVDPKNKTNPIRIKDNGIRSNFSLREEVVAFIDKNNIEPTYYFAYPKSVALSFGNLKPIASIDSVSLIKVLRNMKKQIQSERLIQTQLSAELKSKYNINRHHYISYLVFFLLEGYSPFINDNDLNSLKTKYSNNFTIRDLFRNLYR